MECERFRSGRRREPTVGKLSRHRVIRAIAAAVAVLCLQAAPASASSTLLSGYGGPGQGNQAIIGATLIGGGGSSGSESGSTGTSASAPASIALPRATVKTTAKSRPRKRTAGRHAKPAAPTPGGSAQAATPAAARSAGGTLGLSGTDLLYVILAFCALAGTAILTVRLSGRTGPAAAAQQRQRSG